MPGLSQFDPFGSETIECPYAFHRALRHEAPVYQVARAGYYVVSRVGRHSARSHAPEIFSSNLMAVLMAGQDGGSAMLDLRAQGHEQVDALALADPPVHTRQRKLVNKAFNVRRVAAPNPRSGAGERLVDAFAARGRVEWMEEFAVPLPLTVIADLVSLRAPISIGCGCGPTAAPLFSGVNTAGEFAELNRQMGTSPVSCGAVRAPLPEPRDDLMGDLVRATQDSTESLTNAEAVRDPGATGERRQ